VNGLSTALFGAASAAAQNQQLLLQPLAMTNSSLVSPNLQAQQSLSGTVLSTGASQANSNTNNPALPFLARQQQQQQQQQPLDFSSAISQMTQPQNQPSFLAPLTGPNLVQLNQNSRMSDRELKRF